MGWPFDLAVWRWPARGLRCRWWASGLAESGSDAPHGWALIRRRPKFGALWTARTVSFAGDSLTNIALVLYVANGGGGPAVAALLLVTDFAPAVLTPVLGSLGDRFDRRRLMITTQLLQATVVATIGTWRPGLAGLLVLVAVNANLARVFQPASSSAVPMLVPGADLTAANSLLGFGTNGLAIVGPLAAAGLLPLVGLRGVLLLDAATFVVAAAVLSRLPTLPPVHTGPSTPDGTGRRGFWRETIDGLRYLWANRIVRVTVLGFAGLVACTALDDIALVFLARHSLRVGNSAASVLYAGADLGLLLGFAALTRIPRVPPAVLFAAGMAVSSLGNLLTGASWLISLAIACQVVRGLGIAGQDAGSHTLLQRHVPSAMQARVFANLYNAIGLAAGISYLGGGLGLVSASPRVVLVAAGAAGLGVAAVTAIALARALREFPTGG